MTRHKKFLKSEKTKTKLKGAKLPKGLNVTKTEFKVKKIVIRDQIKEAPTLVDGTVVRSSIKVIWGKLIALGNILPIEKLQLHRLNWNELHSVGFVDQIATSQCRQSKRWSATFEGNHYISSARNEQTAGCHVTRHLPNGIGCGKRCAARMLQSIELGVCFTNTGFNCAICACDHIVFEMCYDAHQPSNSRGFAVTARLFAIVCTDIGCNEQWHHFHMLPRYDFEVANRIESAAYTHRQFTS